MAVWKPCVLTSLAALSLVLVPQPAYSQVEASAAGGPLLRPVDPGPLGLQPSPGSPSADAIAPNQRIANAIADQLRSSGQLRNYQVTVVYQNGVAELTGQVADAAQRDEALRLTCGVPGVGNVIDRIAIVQVGALQAVPAVGSPLQLVQEGPRIEPPPLPAADGGLPEPTPIFQAGPQALPNPAIQPPRMPPYAWPTYAPYNNYSRVAYPSLYPYESWPFIGPFYPFPKVPLGWRSVQLKWMDGHWWYGKYATGHDWWRVRYR